MIKKLKKPLEHQNLTLAGYRNYLNKAANNCELPTILESAQKYFIPKKSKLRLLDLSFEVLGEGDMPKHDNNYNLFKENELKKLGRRADKHLRREAEETARKQGLVGWKASSLAASSDYKKVHAKKIEITDKYLAKNKIQVRTEEQDRAELNSFLGGFYRLKTELKYVTYYLTITCPTSLYNRGKVQDGLDYLNVIIDRLLNIPDSFGYIGTEPHENGMSHNHVQISFDPKHQDIFEKRLKKLDEKQIENHRKKLINWKKIEDTEDDFKRTLNYTVKGLNDPNYKAWGALHGVKLVKQFGFHRSKKIWRMARRYELADILNMPKNSFKNLLLAAKQNNSALFFRLFRLNKPKSLTICHKYRTKSDHIIKKRLETIGYINNQWEIWANSANTPRPHPKLFTQIPHLIDSIIDASLKIKSFTAASQLSEFISCRYGFSELVLNQFKSIREGSNEYLLPNRFLSLKNAA